MCLHQVPSSKQAAHSARHRHLCMVEQSPGRWDTDRHLPSWSLPLHSLPFPCVGASLMTDFGALLRTKVLPYSLLPMTNVFLGYQPWLLTGRNSQTKGALASQRLRQDGHNRIATLGPLGCPLSARTIKRVRYSLHWLGRMPPIWETRPLSTAPMTPT